MNIESNSVIPLAVTEVPGGSSQPEFSLRQRILHLFCSCCISSAVEAIPINDFIEIENRYIHPAPSRISAFPSSENLAGMIERET